MPSDFKGSESICTSGVTGGSQKLTVLEAEVSLTGNEWQKHPIVTDPKALCILGIDYLRRGYFKDPKGYRWASGITALEMGENSCLLCLVSSFHSPPHPSGGSGDRVTVSSFVASWGQTTPSTLKQC